MINVFQPNLGTNELKAIARTMRSNWIGRGKQAQQFEEMFAKTMGLDSRNFLSITSATEGLFTIMRAFGIGSGDEVILPTISFVGAANAIMFAGAKPVFCDVNPFTLNPEVEHIAAKVTGTTRAVLILHYGGVPCNIDEIALFCKEFDLLLIEDNACSVASAFDWKPCGGYGDASVWSFDAMKIMSTGDGGMLYIADPNILSKAKSVLFLGLSESSGLKNADKTSKRWWEFEVDEPGRRGLMNDLTASIGIEQLKRLPEFILKRQRNHALYISYLTGIPGIELPVEVPAHVASSYYFFWIATDCRDELARYLYDRGVYTTFRYYPLHKVQYYNSTDQSFPNAEIAAERTLLLPQHQSLTDEDIEIICSHIKQFVLEKYNE